MKTIIASGPVIINNGKLLVSKDNKDDFYKIPGGTLQDNESLEECCIREAKEEANAEINIIKSLSPMLLRKNPTSGEKQTILLIHYLSELKNFKDIYAGEGIKEIKWLGIEDIKNGTYNVSPNIKYLIEKGDIK
ncbi:MAG: NUDIX domain-containing protein [Candidatus Nanoarchaeia archaeon]